MHTRKAETSELLQCQAIRREVFVLEQAVPETLEMDGADSTCTHVLAWAGSEPVGTARLRVTSEAYAKVERVAVRKAWRGQGVGLSLMQEIERLARIADHHELRLSAQSHTVRFYEKLGYVAEGEEFIEAGIPHRKMKKSLRVAS